MKKYLIGFFLLLLQLQVEAQCPSCYIPGPNLITNPGFEAGNTGFSSDYGFGTSGPGNYIIDDDASKFFGGFVGKDHTTGSGKFMINDGSGQNNAVVWSQSIDSIIPNQDYYFSAWICNLYNAPYSILQFTINGVKIGNTFSPTFAQGKWVFFYIVWNSGADTTATISLVNKNTNSNGNDFGLDDIGFSTCTPSPVLALNLGPDAPICSGVSRMFDVGSGFDSVRWSDNSSGQTLTVSNPGKYWVAVYKDNCKATDTVEITGIYPPPSIELGNDTALCSDSILLHALNPEWPRVWSTGDTSEQISVNQSGMYKVSIGIPGCQATDSINITIYYYPSNFLGNDTFACAGDTLYLNPPPNNNFRYSWNDGDTNQFKNVTLSGQYSLRVYSTICFYEDTITTTFFPKPNIELGNDTSICAGMSLLLDATFPGCSYLWNTGDTSPTLMASETKKYSVTVYAGNCYTTDSIKVKIDSGPNNLLADTFIICPEEKDELTLYPGHASSYNWQPINSTDSIIKIITAPLLLNITMTNELGCTSTKNILIQDYCPPRVYIPTAFSPNRNNINERFLIKGAYIRSFHISIYNRWGERVYEGTDINDGWDGTFKDKPCPADLYIYVAEYEGKYKGDELGKLISGTLILLR